MKVLKFFRVGSEIKCTDKQITVLYMHWFEKSKGFTISWNDIIEIRAHQIEPLTLCLSLTDISGKNNAVNEDMAGWDQFFNLVIKKFAEFQLEKVDKAKLSINEEFICWRK